MSDRFFKYVIPEWFFRILAGGEINDLIELAQKLDADLDLQMDHDDWAAVNTADDVGIACVLPSMGQDEDGVDIPPFFPGPNNPDHQERVHRVIRSSILQAAKVKIKNILVFTGYETDEDRAGQFGRIRDFYALPFGDAQESLVALAANNGVVLHMEMLNTVGDAETWKGHPGYLGDSTLELVNGVIRPVGSTHFRLAADFYHELMMGEDPIEIVEECHDVIGLVHVAGFADEEPGIRNELNHPQQKADFAEIMAKLAEYFEPGELYCLIEYLATMTASPYTVDGMLQKAIDTCESGIKRS